MTRCHHEIASILLDYRPCGSSKKRCNVSSDICWISGLMKEATSPTLVKICQFGLPREMIVIRTVFGAFEGRVVPKPLGNLVEQFCEFQALI